MPLPEAPARYAIFLFAAYTAAGGAILLYLKRRGREDWLEKAGVAMQESERGVEPAKSEGGLIALGVPESPVTPLASPPGS